MDVIDNTTRKEKETREMYYALRESVDDFMRHPNVAGWALVVWTHDYDTAANWNAQYSTLPGAVMPEFFKQAIQTRLNDLSAIETLDDRA